VDGLLFHTSIVIPCPLDLDGVSSRGLQSLPRAPRDTPRAASRLAGRYASHPSNGGGRRRFVLARACVSAAADTSTLGTCLHNVFYDPVNSSTVPRGRRRPCLVGGHDSQLRAGKRVPVLPHIRPGEHPVTPAVSTAFRARVPTIEKKRGTKRTQRNGPCVAISACYSVPSPVPTTRACPASDRWDGVTCSARRTQSLKPRFNVLLCRMQGSVIQTDGSRFHLSPRMRFAVGSTPCLTPAPSPPPRPRPALRAAAGGAG